MATVELEYYSGETRKLSATFTWGQLLDEIGQTRRVVVDHGEGEGEVYWREGEAWYGVREGVSGTTFVADRHLANIIRDSLGATTVLVTKLQRRRTSVVRVWIYEHDLKGQVEIRATHKGLKVTVSVAPKGRLLTHLFAGLAAELLKHLDEDRDAIQDFAYTWCGW